MSLQETNDLYKMGEDSPAKPDTTEVPLDADLYVYRLCALQKALDDNGGGLKDAFGDIVKDQMKYIIAAGKAMKASKKIQERYGNSIEGVKKLADVMRKDMVESEAREEILKARKAGTLTNRTSVFS